MWTTKLRKVTDSNIHDGKTDIEVAAVLQALGLTPEQALFRAANRRSKLLKDGHNVAEQTTVVSNGIDEDAIRELVKTEVSERHIHLNDQAIREFIRLELKEQIADLPKPEAQATEPEVIEIKTPEATKKIEGAHYLMPRLLKLLGAGMHVYLWGPAGTGKTTAGMQAAEALGRESEIDTLDPSSFRSMVQGARNANGDPMETAFTRCWTEGKTYIADETDNAPGHVQTLFNSALANGHAPLAWGSIERKEGFGFVGTGNTPGRPTRAFPDRRPMSQAFADRLYFLYWPLDESIECRKAGLPVPERAPRKEITCTPQEWGRWVQKVRKYCEANAPTIQVTPRATIQGLIALQMGETPEEIADGLVFRGCDDELRRKILSSCPLPGEEVTQ